MEKPKYILIVSQYYYSHHCFVVMTDEEDFREKALTLIERLENYKRGDNYAKEYNYGYPREKAYTDISYRWNVNDAGDIYFIPCYTISAALKEAEEYNSELSFIKKAYKKAPEAQREKIETEISRHHRYGKVINIVSEIFTIL